MTIHEKSLHEDFCLHRRNLEGQTKRLDYWGFNNETDQLTDVLLGPTTNLKHLATSSLSKKHLRDNPCNIEVAQAQHAELVAAYEHFDVNVHMHQARPELAHLNYARDSSVMTPYGPFITAMAQSWRRGENYESIRTYERLGIPIYEMVTAGTFEGGDFCVVDDDCVLIGCGGARTQEEAARQVQGWFEQEGWETRIVFFDPYYVHIDLMVCPIAPKLTAVCLDTLEPWVVDWLKAKGHELVDVPFPHTMDLGCNVMSVGNDRVIAPKTSTVLNEALKAHGIEVAELDLSELSKTGGGIHCMAQSLRRVRS